MIGPRKYLVRRCGYRNLVGSCWQGADSDTYVCAHPTPRTSLLCSRDNSLTLPPCTHSARPTALSGLRSRVTEKLSILTPPSQLLHASLAADDPLSSASLRRRHHLAGASLVNDIAAATPKSSWFRLGPSALPNSHHTPLTGISRHENGKPYGRTCSPHTHTARGRQYAPSIDLRSHAVHQAHQLLASLVPLQQEGPLVSIDLCNPSYPVVFAGSTMCAEPPRRHLVLSTSPVCYE